MASLDTMPAWPSASYDTTTIPIKGDLQELPTSSGELQLINREDFLFPGPSIEQQQTEGSFALYIQSPLLPELTKHLFSSLILQPEDEIKIPETTSQETLVSIDAQIFEALKEIAKEHFEIEPSLHIVAVYSKESPREFLLIEVNEEAIPTRHVEPFYFAPDADFVWPMYIADVTCEEWAHIEQGIIPLPSGWHRKPMLIFRRAEALG